MLNCIPNCKFECCTDTQKTVTLEEADRLSALGTKLGTKPAFGEGIWKGLVVHLDKPCNFYVNGQCLVYDHRPLICRMYYCPSCGTLGNRRKTSKQIFLEGRSRENGWFRFDAPSD